VLDVLDLRLHAPDLVRDPLRELAVAGSFGVRERLVQPAQLVLKPLQLAPQLGELRAGRVVRSLAGLTSARRPAL
jgi:hypothetical protein